ncbi:MAG: ABC transporter ATP-binding protein [Planctomycetota bacterium]|nr:MAG: ABC transporter ATP-binding protein [Planctomycetota bacterium]
MIELIDVTVSAGKFQLTNINLSIPDNQYGILLGRTGSGKTTIMETICGLKKTTKGTILIDGQDITQLKPAERGVGFVPQDGALFDQFNVFDNLAFSLKIRKWKKSEINERVCELAELLGIESLLNRNTTNLSGGEKQRVSLGRALAFFPSVLCFDEPLSALDEETHDDMCHLLKNAQQYSNASVLHISHNPKEHQRLADLTFEIKDGNVIQYQPEELILKDQKI